MLSGVTDEECESSICHESKDSSPNLPHLLVGGNPSTTSDILILNNHGTDAHNVTVNNNDSSHFTLDSTSSPFISNLRKRLPSSDCSPGVDISDPHATSDCLDIIVELKNGRRKSLSRVDAESMRLARSQYPVSTSLDEALHTHAKDKAQKGSMTFWISVLWYVLSCV